MIDSAKKMSMHNMKQKLLIELIFILICTFLLFCSQTENSNAVFQYPSNVPLMQIIETDSISLQWKISQECLDNVVQFEILYKTSDKNAYWISLGKTTAAEHNHFILKRDSLVITKDNTFEIALRTITIGGDTSGLTRSTEQQMDGGWYLLWE